MSAVRGPQRFSCARSRPSRSSTSCARASSARGVERGLDRDAEVDERRLIFEAPGRRAVVGRARGQPHLGAVAQQRRRRGRGWRGCRRHCRRARAAPRVMACGLRAHSVTPTSLKVAAIGACGLWMVTVTLRTRGKPPAPRRRPCRRRPRSAGSFCAQKAVARASRPPCRRRPCRPPCRSARRADRSMSSSRSMVKVCPTLAS